MPPIARRATRVELCNDAALNQQEAKALLRATRYVIESLDGQNPGDVRFTAREAEALETAWSKLEFAIRLSQPER